jgi:hypothetical protein
VYPGIFKYVFAEQNGCEEPVGHVERSGHAKQTFNAVPLVPGK